MNLTEWAAFNGDLVGCTIHVIDKAIDTGDIILARPAAADKAADIASLRAAIAPCRSSFSAKWSGALSRPGVMPLLHS